MRADIVETEPDRIGRLSRDAAVNYTAECRRGCTIGRAMRYSTPQ